MMNNTEIHIWISGGLRHTAGIWTTYLTTIDISNNAPYHQRSRFEEQRSNSSIRANVEKGEDYHPRRNLHKQFQFFGSGNYELDNSDSYSFFFGAGQLELDDTNSVTGLILRG